MPRTGESFSADFKRFFGRGLAVLLPSVLTLWILWTAFVFVFNNVAEPINRGLRAGVLYFTPRLVEDRRLPQWFHVDESELAAFRAAAAPGTLREATDDQIRALIRAQSLREFWHRHWYLNGAGLVVAITLIYLAGLLLGGLLGRRAYAFVETWIARIPGFKQVYPHVKQLVDLVIGEKQLAFKRCVLVPYPREGIWSVGFVTSKAMRSASTAAREDCLTVFIPSTPTPFTGFTIVVPQSSVIDLPISIDEALRYVLTGGVLVPEKEATAPLEGAAAELARRLAQAPDAGPVPPGGTA